MSCDNEPNATYQPQTQDAEVAEKLCALPVCKEVFRVGEIPHQADQPNDKEGHDYASVLQEGWVVVAFGSQGNLLMQTSTDSPARRITRGRRANTGCQTRGPCAHC